MTDFAIWYAKYPRKVGRGAAEKAWRRLTADDKLLALSALPAHIERWRIAATLWEYIPHPASWLNGQRYADEFPNSIGHQQRSVGSQGVIEKPTGAPCPVAPNMAPINGATHAESRTRAQPRAEKSPSPVAPPTLTLVDKGFRSSAGPVDLKQVFANMKLKVGGKK